MKYWGIDLVFLIEKKEETVTTASLLWNNSIMYPLPPYQPLESNQSFHEPQSEVRQRLSGTDLAILKGGGGGGGGERGVVHIDISTLAS